LTLRQLDLRASKLILNIILNLELREIGFFYLFEGTNGPVLELREIGSVALI